jgi:hypothetical protein
MNNELERIWKEAVVVQIEVLSRHLPGRTEKNHEKLQSGYPFSVPAFDPGTSRIRSKGANHSTTTFSKWRVLGLWLDERRARYEAKLPECEYEYSGRGHGAVAPEAATD